MGWRGSNENGRENGRENGDSVARRWLRVLLVASVGLTVTFAPCAGAAAALVEDPPVAQAAAAPEAPERAIVLRPRRIDLELRERVVRSVARPTGPIDVITVARLVRDSRWLTADAGTVTLHAALLQAPGTHLVVSAPAATTLRLAGAPGSDISLRGSNARLSIAGAEVVGWDAAAQQPFAPGADRPFVAYTNGSQVEVHDSSFSSLGRDGDGMTGVTLSRANVSITGSRFSGNQIGLVVRQPVALAMAGVHVAASIGSGLVVETPKDARIERLRSGGNGGHGFELTHGGERLNLVGAVLAGNGRAGAFVDGQQGLAMQDLSTTGNREGGVHIKSARQVVLSDLRSEGDARGVVVAGNSTGVLVEGTKVRTTGIGIETGPRTVDLTLRRVSVTHAEEAAFDLAGADLTVETSRATDALTGVDLSGAVAGATLRDFSARRVSSGLVAKKQVRGLSVDRFAVRRADVGLALAGKDIVVRGGLMDDTKTGIRIYGAADKVSVTGTRITDAGVGFLATSSTKRIALRDVQVRQQTGIGLSSSSPGLSVTGAELTGSILGLDFHGASARVASTTIRGAQDGIRVGSGGNLELEDTRVDAAETALRVASEADVSVAQSRLRGTSATAGPGSVSFTGENDLPPTPTPWYGLAALIAAASAVTLEIIRRLRELEPEWVTLAAAHITNRR